VPRFLGLGIYNTKFLLNIPNRPIFDMTPRKSHRVRKPRTIWEEKGAPPAAKDPKITKKTARTAEKTALKPVVIGSLPNGVGFDAENLPELPTYEPPLDLKFEASESLATGLSELETFKKLLTPAIIDTIVTATNSYAENARRNASKLPGFNGHVRPWKPVNSTDIWRYLGCLLHMGTLMDRKYEEH
jgi:Transposase IS4